MSIRGQKQKRKMCKSCRHKVNYKTNESAQKRAGFLHTKGVYVKPYDCHICKGVHLCKRDPVSTVFAILEGLKIKDIK